MFAVVKKSKPLLLTAFVNKCGNIGITLIPMLLVEKKISIAAAATIMSLIKAAALLGTFLGGWLSDRRGVKSAVLTSFLLVAVGLGVLPWCNSPYLICAVGFVASCGHYMFPSSGRLMLTRLVTVQEQPEAIGWWRTVTNAAQIISYTLSWSFAGLGLWVFMLFDSFTSVIAGVFGWRTLPEVKGHTDSQSAKSKNILFTLKDWMRLLSMALVTACYFALMEFFNVGAAGKFRKLYGAAGLSLFSQLMVINTVLSALFAVLASRRLRHPNVVLPVGLVLIMVGDLLALSSHASMGSIFVGTFLLSVGEIVFMSLAMVAIIRMTPDSKNQGAIYGTALVIQVLGRILGASAAFPLVVGEYHPEIFILVVGFVALLLGARLRRTLQLLFET